MGRVRRSVLAKEHRHRHMQFCLLMGARVTKGKWPLESLVHTTHVMTVALTADSLLLLTSCRHVPQEATTRAVDHMIKISKQMLKLKSKHSKRCTIWTTSRSTC